MYSYTAFQTQERAQKSMVPSVVKMVKWLKNGEMGQKMVEWVNILKVKMVKSLTRRLTMKITYFGVILVLIIHDDVNIHQFIADFSSFY